MKRKRVKRNSTREKQAQAEKRKKNILIAFMCVFLICAGYIGADTYMIRHAAPVTADYVEKTNEDGESAEDSTDSPNVASIGVSSLALDDSVMLSSVISDTNKARFKSVTFDMKRDDGTIGYASSLTMVDTFGAISMPGTKVHESLKTLKEKNITAIARICCYKDNVVPAKSGDMALMKDNKLYKDEKGNTYLNPDSASTYKYIKDIVLENYNLGMRCFVLASTDLPDDVTKDHGDGFDVIAKKLKRDVGNDMVLYEEISVNLSGWNEADGEYNEAGFRNQIKKMPKLKDGQIYYVTTKKEVKDVIKALKKNKVKRYIIAQE